MGRSSTYLVVQRLAVLRVCDHAVQTLQADVTPILLLHPLLTLQHSSAMFPAGCRPGTKLSAIMHRWQESRTKGWPVLHAAQGPADGGHAQMNKCDAAAGSTQLDLKMTPCRRLQVQQTSGIFTLRLEHSTHGPASRCKGVATDSSSMIAGDSHCQRLYLGAQPAARAAPGGAIALVLAAEARVPEGALHERDPAVGLQDGATNQHWGPVHDCLTKRHAVQHEETSNLGTLPFPGCSRAHDKCAAVHAAALVDLQLLQEMWAGACFLPGARGCLSLRSSTSGSLPGGTH